MGSDRGGGRAPGRADREAHGRDDRGALVVLPFVLYAGAAFFIPLFVSLFMSYALSPVVDWMERCRVPRALAPP